MNHASRTAVEPADPCGNPFHRRLSRTRQAGAITSQTADGSRSASKLPASSDRRLSGKFSSFRQWIVSTIRKFSSVTDVTLARERSQSASEVVPMRRFVVFRITRLLRIRSLAQPGVKARMRSSFRRESRNRATGRVWRSSADSLRDFSRNHSGPRGGLGWNSFAGLKMPPSLGGRDRGRNPPVRRLR